jgi:hypothetical protein
MTGDLGNPGISHASFDAGYLVGNQIPMQIPGLTNKPMKRFSLKVSLINGGALQTIFVLINTLAGCIRAVTTTTAGS